MKQIPRLAITPGEPTGIGPDILIRVAARPWAAQLIAVADPDLLRRRADTLGETIAITPFQADAPPERHRPGQLPVLPVATTCPAIPGQLDAANAGYVLATLDAAARGCMDGTFQALVTGPVQKSVINDAGIPFSGHTEYLAHASGTPRVVMMLANRDLRVALATTHIPLAQVSRSLTRENLYETIRILNTDLHARFHLENPRIAVCGLNPHAGEDGHLGREEQEVMQPVLARLRAEGLVLAGPVPADTAFTAANLAVVDAVLAMYHDQGLPVIKHQGFGHTVNVTLGLPFIRTSVDHGTALDLAGSGHAYTGSLEAALEMALEMVGG